MREVAKAHNFGGFDYSPLEDSKIVEFVEKLHDLVRQAEAELKKLGVSCPVVLKHLSWLTVLARRKQEGNGNASRAR